ncbi:MAG: hypothetical protein PF795_10780 [Kiritimatiellae bacterium]|jgi:galactose mutarotase-like enzyme|nr:hypothetical protein [Kiritimatiellia bacterium]
MSNRFHLLTTTALALCVCLASAAEPARQPAATIATTEDGFTRFTLENASWRVEVVPELGGLLTSLRDQVTEREWLWSSTEDRQLNVNQPGDTIHEGPLLGVFECFPNMNDGEDSDLGKLLPHGEVWSTPHEVDADAWKSGTLVTSLELEHAPFRYEREIELVDNDLRLTYRITNLSPRDLPYLWAFHPFFTLRPGDRLLYDSPADPPSFISGAPGLSKIKKGSTFDWPVLPENRDLSHLLPDLEGRGGLKWFSPAPSDGSIRLFNSKEARGLKIHVASPHLPWVGFWLSRGIWGGYHHLAIEPTNRATERLDTDPAATQEQTTLPAGESREWTLILSTVPVNPH